ncbi:hypothetical protein ACRAWD_31955 [Caulobacter segnis]
MVAPLLRKLQVIAPGRSGADRRAVELMHRALETGEASTSSSHPRSSCPRIIPHSFSSRKNIWSSAGTATRALATPLAGRVFR